VTKAMNEGVNEVRIQEQKKQGTQKYKIHKNYKQGKSN
jgi:hypothetical protein